MKRSLLLLLVVAMFSLLVVEGMRALGASPPDHDTFVRVTQVDTNFNTQKLSVAASTTSCNPTDITYLRWDLTDIPAAAVVYTASLTLMTSYTSNTSDVVLGLYETENGWQEETLTYQTAPALGALIETQPAPIVNGQTVTFDSVALVAYLNNRLSVGDGGASFALRFVEGCGIFALALFNDREISTASPNLYLEFEIFAPDLTLSKTGPAITYPGETITYTLVYTNAGNAPAYYAVITDTLPAEVQVYDYSGSVILPLLDNTITWELYDLAPGDTGILTITAIVSPTFTGVFTNVATIATTALESDMTNNVTLPVVTTVHTPDVTIHKSGPGAAYSGDIMTYTLVYTNVGAATAPYVTITDLLPPNVQLYDYTETAIIPVTADSLTWEVFNLAPNAGGTLTVSVIISPTFTGWLTNTATIATTAPEVVVDNNASALRTQVASPPVTWHYLYLPLVMRVAP